MPHKRPEQSPFLHSQKGAFFATIDAKGGLRVHEYIARLIKAGMPRKIAAFVCADYNRRWKMDDLAQYVEAVEKENGEMGDVE